MNNANLTQDREVIILPNGARIGFDPMPHLGSACVGVWLGAGARHEPASHNGLAHFLEHMAFKGAAGRNAREIAEAVEARGSNINADTAYERTGYHVRCLSEDPGAMLDIVLSLVFAPDHPEAEIEREKGVVLQEIGEAADQPDDLVFELAQAASFEGHPLGLPILGIPKTLRRVQRADLFSFADTAYAPSRTVVAIAGGYDRAELESIARRWLEPRAARQPVATAAPSAPSPNIKTAARDLEQLHLVFARPSVSAVSDDRFAARVFTEIFGGGMSSRLFQEVREEKGLAYAIDSSCEQYADTGRISVYAGCSAEDAAEVAKITTGVWHELAGKGPTEAELQRAKAVMKANFVMAIEAPAARAGSLAYELLTFDKLLGIEGALKRIDAVTQADVRRIAADALAGAAIAAAVGPKAGLSAAEVFVSAAN